MTNETQKNCGNGLSQLSIALAEIYGSILPVRVNGKVAGARTQELHAQVISRAFRLLYKLGFKIENPVNIGSKHVEALVRHWHSSGKKVKTMANDLSILRTFCRKIGKGDMVKSLQHYLREVPPDQLKVIAAAEKSKSWTARGVSVPEKIEQASLQDTRFALMIMLIFAFGLRRIEALKTRPHVADRGHLYQIFPGEAKGGRNRAILIDTHEKRQILDYVKSKIGKDESLGWPNRSLPQSIARFNYLMKKIGITKAISGVTGHGLRAQFAENSLLLAGYIAPTLGGPLNQMDVATTNVVRSQISQDLGHNRNTTGPSYYGAFKGAGKFAPRSDDEIRGVLTEAGTTLAGKGHLDEVQQDRVADCSHLLCDLLKFGVDLSMQEIQALWQIYSARFALSWAPIPSNSLVALEVAARKVLMG